MPSAQERDSAGLIYSLLPKIADEIGAITKIRKQQQNDMFRGIDDVLNAVHGPLFKLGVFVTPDNKLIVGRRCIAALKKLGRFKIPARVARNLDDLGLLLKAEQQQEARR